MMRFVTHRDLCLVSLSPISISLRRKIETKCLKKYEIIVVKFCYQKLTQSKSTSEETFCDLLFMLVFFVLFRRI